MKSAVQKLDRNCKIKWGDSELVTLLMLKNEPDFDPYLNDRHVDAAGAMLAPLSPDFRTMQSCLLGYTTGFKTCIDRKWVQIVNVDQSHWCLVSHDPADSLDFCFQAKLYDSALQPDQVTQLTGHTYHLDNSLVDQICQLVIDRSENGCKSGKRVLKITVMPCQQQPGTVNCGLYAVANATSIVLEHEPAQLLYKGDLRKQFFDMFVNHKMSMFQNEPITVHQTSAGVSTRSQNTHQPIAIQKCEQFYVLLENCCNHYNRSMPTFMCSTCSEEFHYHCYMLHEDIEMFHRNLTCYSCRESGKCHAWPNATTDKAIYTRGRCANSIKSLLANDLITALDATRRSSVPSSGSRLPPVVTTREQLALFRYWYGVLEGNKIAAKYGEIYEAYIHVLHKFPQLVEEFPELDVQKLNSTDTVRVIVTVVAHTTNVQLPPLNYKKDLSKTKMSLNHFQGMYQLWVQVLCTNGEELRAEAKEYAETRITDEADSIRMHYEMYVRVVEQKFFIEQLKKDLKSVEVRILSDEQKELLNFYNPKIEAMQVNLTETEDWMATGRENHTDYSIVN